MIFGRISQLSRKERITYHIVDIRRLDKKGDLMEERC